MKTYKLAIIAFAILSLSLASHAKAAEAIVDPDCGDQPLVIEKNGAPIEEIRQSAVMSELPLIDRDPQAWKAKLDEILDARHDDDIRADFNNDIAWGHTYLPDGMSFEERAQQLNAYINDPSLLGMSADSTVSSASGCVYVSGRSTSAGVTVPTWDGGMVRDKVEIVIDAEKGERRYIRRYFSDSYESSATQPSGPSERRWQMICYEDEYRAKMEDHKHGDVVVLTNIDFTTGAMFNFCIRKSRENLKKVLGEVEGQRLLDRADRLIAENAGDCPKPDLSSFDSN